MTIEAISRTSPDEFSNWQAQLALQFERRGAQSVLAQRRHTGPLIVQKTLHPEGNAVCHTVIVHPPGGIASGDQLDIDLTLSADAHALLTTPGATKWYRSRPSSSVPPSYSRQSLTARVAAGAVLEWLPQENIIFDAARAEINLRVELAPGAKMLGWEIVCLGRAASGERFTHGKIMQHTDVLIDDHLAWHERGRLTGDDPLIQSPVGLSNNTVYGVFWIAGLSPDRTLIDALRAVSTAEGTRCAITALPHITLARALSNSSEALRNCFIRLWQTARPHCLGREAILPRIWTT